jgi:hypothetical protein
MNRALLVSGFTLVILLISRMVWTMVATGIRENKASGVAALAGSIGQPWFLVICLIACVGVYFVVLRLAANAHGH